MHIRTPSNYKFPGSTQALLPRNNYDVCLCTYVSITLRNVANQRSHVIIIAREEGGAWERIIINAPQAVDRSEG